MRRRINMATWLPMLRLKTRRNFHHFRKHPPLAGFVIILLAASLTSCFEHTGFLHSLTMANFDSYIVSQDPIRSSKVALVVIDEEDYKDTFKGTSPLDQVQVMSLIRSIAAAGPTAIVVDLDTSHWAPSSTTPKWSGALKRLPSGTPPIIWARPVSREEGQPEQLSAVGGKRDADLIDRSLCWGVPEVLATRGVVRSYRPLVRLGNGTVPSLASAAAIVSRTAKTQSPVLSGEAVAAPNCKELSVLGKPATKEALLKAGVLTFPTYTSSQLREFQDFPFEDKVVVLGGTYPEARDTSGTPLGPRAGIEILATAIDSELDHPMPLHPSGWRFFTIDILLGIFLLMAGHILPKVLGVPFVIVGVPAAAIAGSFIVFQSASYFFSFMPVLFGIFLHRFFDEWWEGLEMREKDSKLRKEIASRNRKIRDLELQLALADDSRPTFSEKDSIDLSLKITRGRA
jgi:CHASE2 domain-containing sensor protein